MSRSFGIHKTGQFLKVEIDLPPLIPDTYAISAWIGSHNTETISWDRDIVAFEIHDSPIRGRSFVHSSQNGFLVPNSRTNQWLKKLIRKMLRLGGRGCRALQSGALRLSVNFTRSMHHLHMVPEYLFVANLELV